MDRLLTALLALSLSTVALTGCIGNDTDDLNETAGVDALGPTLSAATAHRAVPGDTEAESLAGLASLMPGGIPAPSGLARYTGGEAFEPTLGVTSSGTIVLSSFEPGPPGEWVLVRRSSDQGLTWEDITPRIQGLTSFPPQSNDPYVFVDPDTDRIFSSDLQALLCSTLSFSDDGGDSWTMNPIGCGQPVGVHDHQTVFTAHPRTVTTVGYDKVVYYCINRVADSACATSLNGGLTFGPLRPLVYPGIDPERTDEEGTFGVPGFCGGLHGHGAPAPDGTVYLGKGHCSIPTVSISRDDGLTWEIVTIAPETRMADHTHEVSMAVDAENNPYAVWIGDDRRVHLSHSTDAGLTWSEPVVVSAPHVATTDFPTIAAADAGRVAIAYVGTETDKDYDDMEPEDTWNAYLAVLPDALAEAPVVLTTTANDPSDPIARGVCGATRCFGEDGGALGDFIDVVIGPDGRPWAAFVDVCTEACLAEDAEENDVGQAFVGTLGAGPSLVGELSALTPLVGNGTETGS